MTHFIARLILIAAFGALPFCAFARSITIYPAEQQGSIDYSATYFINNEEATNMSVEVIKELLLLSEDGIEMPILTRELTVEPSQFILKAYSLQHLKVQYKEDSLDDEVERVYRLTLKFSPIVLKTPGDSGVMRMASDTIKAYYYVQPKKVRTDIGISDAFIQGNLLALRLFNIGNVHLKIKNPEVVINYLNGKKLYITDIESLRGFRDEQLYANSFRQFYIQLAEDANQPIRTVEVNMKGPNSNNKKMLFEAYIE